MTAKQWASLVHRAAERRNPYFRGYLLACDAALRFQPPAAGEWVRAHYRFARSTPSMWHRFSGDMAWRPGWTAISLLMVDGIVVKSDAMEATPADATPAGRICRRCGGKRRGTASS